MGQVTRLAGGVAVGESDLIGKVRLVTREYGNRGRDQFNIEHARDVYLGESRPEPRHPLLEDLLVLVKSEFEERSRQRLDRFILPVGQPIEQDDAIDLGKVYVPDQVTQPTRREVRVDSIRQKIAEETPILEIFQGEKVGQKLLILGEPGSGKTTLLGVIEGSLRNGAIRAGWCLTKRKTDPD